MSRCSMYSRFRKGIKCLLAQGKISQGLSRNLIILMTVFIDVMGFGMILPLLPFYAAFFQAGSTALGVLVASFALMQFVSSPLLGRLSDKMGRRPIILLSILTSVLSFVLFALADSFIMLLLSRMTAGSATEVGVAQAYISDITSERERTAWIGRMGAAQGAGFIIGPALGGFLSNYGFSVTGFAAAIMAFVNLVFAFFFLPESKAFSESNGGSEGSEISYCGFKGLMDVFSTPLMASLLTILFIMSLAFSAFPVIMPLLAISIFGLSPSDVSFFFVYVGLIQIIFQGLIVGRLSSKLGDEKVILLGSLLMTVGVFFMAVFTNFYVFIILTTIMMAGSGMLGTAIPSFISKRTLPDERGVVLGIAQSISSIARVPGPLIGGLVFELAGLSAPFFLSALMLMIVTFFGVKITVNSQL